MTDQVEVFKKSYPWFELYRLAVEGRLFKRGDQGWLNYEAREPGCLQNFFSAFYFSLQHKDKELTVDLLKQTHQILMQHLVEPPDKIPGQFRTNNVYFRIFNGRADADGIKEFVENYVKAWGENIEKTFGENSGPCLGTMFPIGAFEKNTLISYSRLQAYPKDYRNIIKKAWDIDKEEPKLIYEYVSGEINQPIPSKYYYYRAPTPEVIAELTQKAVQEYNYAIKHPDISDDKKLEIIVKFIKTLELIHPFFNGNGRLFANIWLSTLLMKNGFAPPTFEDPNIFDMISLPNLTQKVKEAIRNTETLYAANPQKDVPLFGFETRKCMDVRQLENFEKQILPYDFKNFMRSASAAAPSETPKSLPSTLKY